MLEVDLWRCVESSRARSTTQRRRRTLETSKHARSLTADGRDLADRNAHGTGRTAVAVERPLNPDNFDLTDALTNTIGNDFMGTTTAPTARRGRATTTRPASPDVYSAPAPRPAMTAPYAPARPTLG